MRLYFFVVIMCKIKLKQMGLVLKVLTLNRFIAITLAPFGVYFKGNYINEKRVINHESIHWRQQCELLFLPFYVWYFVEWFIRLFINGRRAYYMISFEQEAYGEELNYDYLNHRGHYSWFKYIFK